MNRPPADTPSSRVDEGFTLIELAFTMMLLSIVMGMLFQSLVTVQTSVERQVGRNTRNDRLRLAIHSIERQVRSGNVFSDPALADDPVNGIAPGMSMRVYTQADATSAGDSMCVQWRVHGRRLESREWSPQWQLNGILTGWRLIADGVMNRDVSPAVAAFTLPSDAEYGRRILSVTLLAEGDTSERTVQRVETSITGRNTGFGYPVSICDDAPPYPT